MLICARALQLEKAGRWLCWVSEARCFSFLNTLTSASFVTVSQASVVNLKANLGITEEDLLSTLPQARQRVFERHYPELAEPAKKHRGKVKKTKTR
jgi:hypothetical protein